MAGKTIKDIISDGYSLPEYSSSEYSEKEGLEWDLESSFLLNAIKCYYESGRFSSRFSYTSVSDGKKNECPDHEPEYLRCYIFSVISAVHYFELAVKNIFRIYHKYAPCEAMRVPGFRNLILEAKSIDSRINKAQRRTMTFGECLHYYDIILDLLPPNYWTLKKYQRPLKDINLLRNKILHRGSLVLSGKNLDDLFCQHVIPMMFDFSRTEYVKSTNKIGAPIKLAIGDKSIVEMLIEEGSKPNPNYGRISVLKEMGLAAHNIAYKYLFYSEEDLDFDREIWRYCQMSGYHFL